MLSLCVHSSLYAYVVTVVSNRESKVFVSFSITFFMSQTSRCIQNISAPSHYPSLHELAYESGRRMPQAEQVHHCCSMNVPQPMQFQPSGFSRGFGMRSSGCMVLLDAVLRALVARLSGGDGRSTPQASQQRCSERLTRVHISHVQDEGAAV